MKGQTYFLESFLNDTTVTERNSTTLSDPLQFTTISRFIICGVGIAANSLIVVVITLASLRISVFMTLLMFLAITDNLFLLNEVVFGAGNLFSALASSLWRCRLNVFFYYSTGIISSWLLVLISLERYVSVFYPLKIKVLCTVRRTYGMMLVLVVISSLSSLPILFTCSILYENGTPICRFVGSNVIYDTICTFVLNILYNALPFALICTLNTLVVEKIKSRLQFRLQFLGQTEKHSNSSKQTLLVPMMVSVCVFFAVMSFPTMTFTFIRIICRLLEDGQWILKDEVTHIPYLFDYLNHSMNFFLYCLSGSAFRNMFLRLFRCK